MRSRVILGVRGGFLKQRQDPAVTSALRVRDRSPTQRQWNQEVVWQGQETDPRNKQALAKNWRKRVDHQKEADLDPHRHGESEIDILALQAVLSGFELKARRHWYRRSLPGRRAPVPGTSSST